MTTWWTQSDGGIVLRVRAVPGARRSEVVEEADQLRVRVAAPAVEGKANDELCRVLAAWCGVRRSAVTVVRGERSRDKVVHVAGLSAPLHRG